MDVASRFGLVNFGEGQFAGRTLRFRLELAQEPTVGRKSGEKDRRPLANVPIVRVWISEVYSDGSEVRLDENLIDPTSLLCSVDLCAPVSSMHPPLSSPGSNGPSSQPPSFNPSYLPTPMHHHLSSAPTSNNSRNSYPFQGVPSPAQRRNHARIPIGGRGGNLATSSSTGTSSVANGSSNGSLHGSNGSGGSGNGSGTASGSSGTGSSGSGGWTSVPGGGEQHVAVASKMKTKTVRNIFGNLISPAVCLTDLDNEAGLWFIYQDIAIRTEGVYSLRFTLFDLDSRTPDSQTHAPILAECFSSPLTIYAPRNHPGVPPSTKLAKHFVSQGYRLSLKKGGSSGSRNNHSSPPLPTAPRKRRLSKSRSDGDATEIADDDEEDDEDEIDGVGEDEEAGGSPMSGSD